LGLGEILLYYFRPTVGASSLEDGVIHYSNEETSALNKICSMIA